MDKIKFLDQLRMSLAGKLSADQVTENVKYYEDYINTQIRLGKTEQEVMAALGSPRLIAKTIAEANGQQSQSYEYAKEQEEPHEDIRVKGIRAFLKLPSWLRTILVLLVVFLVLYVVFSLVAFLIPFLIPLLVVLFLFKMFKDWLK